MRWKRLLYYLTLNVLVSACTVLSILYYWENYRPLGQLPEPGPLSLATETVAATGTPAASGTGPAAAPEQGTRSAPDYISYTVETGDTLSGLALEFDVSVDAILAANDLDNPDSLSVGDVILIPLGDGVPENTPPPAATATLTPPPPPTLPPTATGGGTGETALEIVTVIGAGDLAEERVIVRQIGDAQVSLQGWQLLGPDGQVFTFPQLVLFEDGAVTIYTKAGANSVAELHWGLDAAIWNSGDVVTLVDPEGDIVAAYQVP